MNCQDIQSNFIDLINNNINQELKNKLNQHLASCEICSKKFSELKTVMEAIETKPEYLPSDDFYSRVSERLNSESHRRKISRGSFTLSYRKLAASIILFLCGGFIGFLFNSTIYMKEELTELNSEIDKLKATSSLAILKDVTASEKLEAIKYTAKRKNFDNEIITALYNTMVSDENPNVRLAAIQVLANYNTDRNVQLMLIEALAFQSDPTIQIALINVLSGFKQKDSRKAIETFINRENLNPEIKEYSRGILLKTSL